MRNQAIDALANLAIGAAVQSANAYLRQQGVTVPDHVLITALQNAIAVRLPEALDDAQQALDARMPQAAEATFVASMALAGIDAAKQCVQEHIAAYYSAPCPV